MAMLRSMRLPVGGVMPIAAASGPVCVQGDLRKDLVTLCELIRHIGLGVRESGVPDLEHPLFIARREHLLLGGHHGNGIDRSGNVAWHEPSYVSGCCDEAVADTENRFDVARALGAVSE